ncbi:hypothetical protein [Nitratireductor indicus]|uniref:hypothetical protein n=1 Tax=Nitratireductor indicus TaxID=721133 RepID=UPI002874BC23|nr:hypothetical protein [Nitratireductor indicus]MDS1136724.1 hypothetical protein [Nitratireductor indicus]
MTDEEKLDALERVIVQLRVVLQKRGLTIEDPVKEARLIRALYQYEMKHGRMTDDYFESMISLAS